MVALESIEAERVRLEKRLARELTADRGFVDKARSRSNARTDLTCFICMDVDSHADAYMPCCLYRVHRACIATWHALGQNKTKHVIMAPKQDNGWTPVAMHECMSARTAVLRYCPRVSRASKYLYLQHHLNATIDILTFTNIISLYLGATMSPSLPA